MKLSPAQRRLLEETAAGKQPSGRYRASSGALVNRGLLSINPQHWIITRHTWGHGRQRDPRQPEFLITDAGREALT